MDDDSQSNDADGSSSDEDPLHDYEEDESSDEEELSYLEDSDDEDDDVIQEDAEARPRRHSRSPTTEYNPDTIFKTGKKGGLRLKAIKILASDIVVPSTHEEAMASCC